MARLPQPGGDEGTWGDVLNQFLLTSHNSDGTVRTSSVQDALPSASNGQVLTYNGTSGQWEGQNGGSGDPAVGGDLSGTASNAQIVAGAVGGTELASGAVSDAKVSASAAIAQSKIANLTSDLAGKASATHTHPQSDITNLTSDLAGKASVSHTHAIADVTNLQSTLDAKVDDNDARLTDQRTPIDGSVTEPKLDAANAPSNGQVLSWNGTNFSWVDQTDASAYVQGDGIAKITVGTSAPTGPAVGDVWINT